MAIKPIGRWVSKWSPRHGDMQKKRIRQVLRGTAKWMAVLVMVAWGSSSLLSCPRSKVTWTTVVRGYDGDVLLGWSDIRDEKTSSPLGRWFWMYDVCSGDFKQFEDSPPISIRTLEFSCEEYYAHSSDGLTSRHIMVIPPAGGAFADARPDEVLLSLLPELGELFGENEWAEPEKTTWRLYRKSFVGADAPETVDVSAVTNGYDYVLPVFVIGGDSGKNFLGGYRYRYDAADMEYFLYELGTTGPPDIVAFPRPAENERAMTLLGAVPEYNLFLTCELNPTVLRLLSLHPFRELVSLEGLGDGPLCWVPGGDALLVFSYPEVLEMETDKGKPVLLYRYRVSELPLQSSLWQTGSKFELGRQFDISFEVDETDTGSGPLVVAPWLWKDLILWRGDQGSFWWSSTKIAKFPRSPGDEVLTVPYPEENLFFTERSSKLVVLLTESSFQVCSVDFPRIRIEKTCSFEYQADSGRLTLKQVPVDSGEELGALSRAPVLHERPVEPESESDGDDAE